MNSVSFYVPGISCGHCVNSIQNEVGELEGVISVKADAGTRQVMIDFQPPASQENIKHLLAEINYPVQED
jgi:copper ion binding protein